MCILLLKLILIVAVFIIAQIVLATNATAQINPSTTTLWLTNSTTGDTNVIKNCLSCTMDSIFNKVGSTYTLSGLLSYRQWIPAWMIRGLKDSINAYSGYSATPDTLSPSRTFGTSYVMSSTKYVDICPNAKLSCSLSLTGGQEGTIILETSPDNTTWTQKGIITGSNTGSLTIGLNTTQSNGGALCTTLPPNYVWRMRTTNVTGTPTFTMQQGSKTTY